MLIFMSFAVSMPLESPAMQNFMRFDNLSYAVDSLAYLAMNDPKVTEFTFLIGEALIGVSDFRVEKIKEDNNEDESSKIAWTQHRVTKEGTWQGPWVATSCVHQNGLGSTPIKITIDGASSVSATWRPGFNINYGNKAALRYGYRTTEKNTNTGIRTYTVPPRSYGQVWQQQLMVWQDQQYRKCLKILGVRGLNLGDWSEDIRGDLPVSNAISIGWSTGWDKMDFETCGENNSFN